tara:strand:+ start:1075 stop:1350 length:276 start_codon:yes stop_codon:yes gene_type:complete
MGFRSFLLGEPMNNLQLTCEHGVLLPQKMEKPLKTAIFDDLLRTLKSTQTWRDDGAFKMFDICCRAFSHCRTKVEHTSIMFVPYVKNGILW